jgi:hypothetical protein
MAPGRISLPNLVRALEKVQPVRWSWVAAFLAIKE